ncbi:MAG TPA: hypothetical protein VIM15_12700 [Gemmatimonadaceae bacterium]
MPYLHQQTSTPDANVSATDLAAQIRDQVTQQLKAAGVSDKVAKSAADGAAQGVTGVTVTTKDGKLITVHTPRPGQAPVAPQLPQAPTAPDAPVIATPGTSIPDDMPFDVPPRIENLGYAFLLMIAVIAVGKPLARALGSLIERRALKPAMPQEFGARLERIEQGIESVSIEVERISESQRYLLKVQVPTPERVELPRSAS